MKLVRTRAIFYIGGYDPKSPEEFFKLFNREQNRFCRLWNVDTEASEVVALTDDIGQQTHKAKGENWSARCDFHFLTLDDIVLKDFARPLLERIMRGLLTAIDYFISGTAFSFIRHAWRFFLYFLYPIVMLSMGLIVSFMAAQLVYQPGSAFFLVSALFTFLAVFTFLVHLGGQRLFVLHLLDLWSFSSDYLRHRRPTLDRKLDQMAALICDQLSQQKYDEVLLIGHSTGGALILDLASRCLKSDPGIMRKTNAFTVLTIGSTALKIGLHPSAKWYRMRLKKLFENKDVNWIEYQCMTDFINFYKTNPADLMELDTGTSSAGIPRPFCRRVRMKDMLDGKKFRDIRTNLFRMHYQFVFGNTQKYHYDFCAICLGPVYLTDRATRFPVRIDSLIPSFED